MPRWKLTLGACLGMILFQVGCQPETLYRAPPPPKVKAVNPTVDNVPIYLEENGQTEAVEQVVVQSRVRGILQQIKFKQDDLKGVAEGDPLFEIEKVEFDAEVNSKKANLESANAGVESAKAAIEVAGAEMQKADAAIKVAQADYDRMKRLEGSKAIAQSELDLAEARLATATAAKQGFVAAQSVANAELANAKAQVEKAKAELEAADIDLQRCDIKAPISGRVTRVLVKEGNVVEKGTPLVEIVADNPIWANFNVSERFLLDFQRESRRNPDNSLDPSNLKAELQRSGDDGFPFEGRLDYVAPKIDQDTGTLQIRAVFENDLERNSRLMPGLFVRIRVQLGQYENALVIPERAVGRDQAGAFVYVVEKDRKAGRRDIKLGPRHNDGIVVESGLEPQDNVITDNLQRVRVGLEVDPG